MLRLFVLLILSAALTPLLHAQDAVTRLSDSPRHHEWVTVSYDGRDVMAFVAYPEVDAPAPAVLVIHENRGLNDWARSVADQLAEAGYVAIAPDLLSGLGPDGGKTSDFPNSDAAREALYSLDPAQVAADLQATADYVLTLPAVNGTLAVGGFCWGGSWTFRFATERQDLAAAFVFYGTAPDDAEALARIEAPVYAFYGGDDARVNATIPRTRRHMTMAQKTYEPVTYEGAGHAFMRRGQTADPGTPNAEARESAWKRWKLLLSQL